MGNYLECEGAEQALLQGAATVLGICLLYHVGLLPEVIVPITFCPSDSISSPLPIHAHLKLKIWCVCVCVCARASSGQQ